MFGRLESWKVGRFENWKVGGLEGLKVGSFPSKLSATGAKQGVRSLPVKIAASQRSTLALRAEGRPGPCNDHGNDIYHCHLVHKGQAGAEEEVVSFGTVCCIFCLNYLHFYKYLNYQNIYKYVHDHTQIHKFIYFKLSSHCIGANLCPRKENITQVSLSSYWEISKLAHTSYLSFLAVT